MAVLNEEQITERLKRGSLSDLDARGGALLITTRLGLLKGLCFPEPNDMTLSSIQDTMIEVYQFAFDAGKSSRNEN